MEMIESDPKGEVEQKDGKDNLSYGQEVLQFLFHKLIL